MDFPHFEALEFGDGLPSQGRRVRAELRSRGLVLADASGSEEEVDYAFLRAKRGGWHGEGLLLEWQSERGTRMLSVHGEPGLATLRTHAPERLRAQLGTIPRPGRARGAVYLTAGIAAAVVVALIAVVTVQSDRLVELAVRRIPPAWEERLGAATVAAYAASPKLETRGEEHRVVEEIAARLTAHVQSPYTFRWYVVDDPQVNAMAAPGGHVVVFTGLVHATESAEELAGVLAHEMQHVLLRHTLRAMVRGLGVRATLSVLLGGAGELGNVTGALIEQWGGLRFSRSQESDADLAGVTLLQAAGIDPHGMVTFFEHLAQRGGEPPAFLSTHPASAARAKAVLDRIAGSPSVPALPYAWDWTTKP